MWTLLKYIPTGFSLLCFAIVFFVHSDKPDFLSWIGVGVISLIIGIILWMADFDYHNMKK